MIDNELICVKIIYPAELTIKSIFVREQSLQEFSGLVVTEENKLYLIKSDNNEFLEMPVNEYNPDTDRLRFQANLLYRFFFIYQDNQQILYVLDSDYRYINKYRYKMDNSDLSFSKQVIQYIFPFEVRMTSENSVYINFYFSNLNISSIYLNILLVLILIFWDWKNTNRINKRWSDYLLVLFTGIYGLIAIKIIE